MLVHQAGVVGRVELGDSELPTCLVKLGVDRQLQHVGVAQVIPCAGLVLHQKHPRGRQVIKPAPVLLKRINLSYLGISRQPFGGREFKRVVDFQLAAHGGNLPQVPLKRKDLMKDLVESLAREFERNPVFGYLSPYELYSNWLEAVWAFMEAVTDRQGFRQCLDRYSHAQGAEYGRLLGLYIEAVECMPFRDILGSVFMRLDVKSVHNGQFFSPWNIAELMARMQFDRQEFERIVAEKGVVTVCDPAVGSGVMLLAYAKVVNDVLGRWGTSMLRLYGSDIDQRCVWMCRIQLRINGLDAFGRMAGLLQTLPDNAVMLPAGRQMELPGVAA